MTKGSKTRGWDERDYKLWSDIRGLPSYGLIGSGGDRMISFRAVEALMEAHAERRADAEHDAAWHEAAWKETKQ